MVTEKEFEEMFPESKGWVPLYPHTESILLTHEKIAIIDEEDAGVVEQYNWHSDWNSKTKSYYARSQFTEKGKRKNIRMHRLIMNPPKDMQIDHINHNTLDNRKQNLRVVTNRENRQNLIKRPVWFCSPGVYYRKDRNKFQSQIVVNKKRKFLGREIDPISGTILYKFVVEEELNRLGIE